MKSIVGSTVTNLRFDRLASNSVVQFEFSDGRFLSFKGTEIEDYPQEFSPFADDLHSLAARFTIRWTQSKNVLALNKTIVKVSVISLENLSNKADFSVSDDAVVKVVFSDNTSLFLEAVNSGSDAIKIYTDESSFAQNFDKEHYFLETAMDDSVVGKKEAEIQ